MSSNATDLAVYVQSSSFTQSYGHFKGDSQGCYIAALLLGICTE